jgi:hypothetical protein
MRRCREGLSNRQFPVSRLDLAHLAQCSIETISLRTGPCAAKFVKVRVLGGFPEGGFEEADSGFVEADPFTATGFFDGFLDFGRKIAERDGHGSSVAILDAYWSIM